MNKVPRPSTILAALAISIACGMCSEPESQKGDRADAGLGQTAGQGGGASGQGGGVASSASTGRTSAGTLSSQAGAAGTTSSTRAGGGTRAETSQGGAAGRSSTRADGGSQAETGQGSAAGGSSTRVGGTKVETGQGGRAGSSGTTGAAGAGERADGGPPRRDGAADGPTLPDAASEAGQSGDDPCQAAGLKWHSGAKTNYTSYPDPGSEECLKYSGCEYEGLFSACSKKRSIEWVEAHNIVAVFPDFDQLKLHDLCLRSGQKTIVVTVLDECGDSDCSGCCTKNRGSAEQLIDIESFTDTRWGIEDGPIEWADLGPTQGTGCQ